MTKKELLDEMVTKYPLTRVEAETAVEAMTEIIRDRLAMGDAVSIRGFGTFRVKHRKPMKAYDFAAGKPITIPAEDVPVFKASKGFLY